MVLQHSAGEEIRKCLWQPGEDHCPILPPPIVIIRGEETPDALPIAISDGVVQMLLVEFNLPAGAPMPCQERDGEDPERG